MTSESAAYSASRLFEYQPETGRLIRKLTVSNAVKGSIAGNMGVAGYRMVGFRGRSCYVHRVVWLMHYGEWPKGQIDHINGNRSDNRIENLRDVSQRTNKQNIREAKANSTTGILGVMRHGDRFRAEVCIDGKNKHLGVFETSEAAHQAYVEAKRFAHAGCTL